MNLRKLALCRETLHTLETPALEHARGGVVQPALNAEDIFPSSYLCQTRFCSGNCFVTAACQPVTAVGCDPTFTF